MEMTTLSKMQSDFEKQWDRGDALSDEYMAMLDEQYPDDGRDLNIYSKAGHLEGALRGLLQRFPEAQQHFEELLPFYKRTMS